MGDVTMVMQSGSNTQTPTAPQPPASPDQAVIVGETPAQGKITITKNGKTITLNGANGGPGTVINTGPGGGDLSGGTAFPFPSDIPPGVQSIATTAIVGFCLMIAAYPVFGFLKALVNRSASRQAALPSRDTTDRLARIESAVEAMSVEVERISEGQRFVTRVLSERSSAQT